MPIQQFASQLYTDFSVSFQPMSAAKLCLYIGSTSCINPVNFQVRTPNVKATVRHNTKCGQCCNLQMARYRLNNSSILPTCTYFFPTRQKAKTSLIHVPGRLDQELYWWKPTKAKYAQSCIILYTTIHHSMYGSLDINTTSNYCPVSLFRVAQLLERQTSDSEVAGLNPTNT